MRFASALLAILACCPLAAQADELGELLKRVPGDMNTVAVINVREINKSPRAVKEKWKDNHETDYLAGAMAVPAWISVVVVGSDLHPGALAETRSIILLPTGNTVNSGTIASRENGIVQTIDGLTLVLSPKRGYYGFPTPGTIGLSSTMQRQDFARWARWAAKPEKPAVSAYLQEQVESLKGAHILIATDLKDAFDPTQIRTTLQLAGVKEGELDSLVRVVSGIRGLAFTAQIGESTKATLRIDFAIAMEDMLPIVRRVWAKTLETAGLEVEEFKVAEMKADGKAIVLTADLSDKSLRRVLSLVAAPGDAVPEDGTARIKTPKEAAGLAASLRYYKAANSALDDLKGQGGAKGKNYVKSADFFDAYAARLEKLPLADVDPLLVQYGGSLAAKMRAMAGSLRGLQVQLETYDNYKSTTWVSSGGGFVTPRGRIGVAPSWNTQMSTNVEELNTKQAELVIKLEPERVRLWEVLEGDRSSIRREMLEKYKLDFDQYKR
jgi:hypothetical protein